MSSSDAESTCSSSSDCSEMAMTSPESFANSGGASSSGHKSVSKAAKAKRANGGKRSREEQQPITELYGELFTRIPKRPTAMALSSEFSDKELRVLMSQNRLLINDFNSTSGKYTEKTKSSKICVLLPMVGRMIHPDDLARSPVKPKRKRAGSGTAGRAKRAATSTSKASKASGGANGNDTALPDKKKTGGAPAHVKREENVYENSYPMDLPVSPLSMPDEPDHMDMMLSGEFSDTGDSLMSEDDLEIIPVPTNNLFQSTALEDLPLSDAIGGFSDAYTFAPQLEAALDMPLEAISMDMPPSMLPVGSTCTLGASQEQLALDHDMGHTQTSLVQDQTFASLPEFNAGEEFSGEDSSFWDDHDDALASFPVPPPLAECALQPWQAECGIQAVFCGA